MKKQIKKTQNRRKKKNGSRFIFPFIVTAIIIVCIIVSLIYLMSSGGKPEDTSAQTSTSPTDDTTGIAQPDTSGEPSSTDESKTSEEISDTSEPSVDTTSAVTDTTTEITTVDTKDYGEEIDGGNYVIVGNRAMEIYYGSAKYGQAYATYLNQYAELLDGKATVYSMVIPKSAAYYISTSKLYGKTQPRTKENLDNINSYLSDKVVSVDVYSALMKHTGEDIYFRTDHHWTALGAYYAAQELAKTAGVGFDDLSAFTSETRSGYLGSMYAVSNYNKRIKDNPDDFVLYYPDTTKYQSWMYSHSFTNPKEHDVLYYVSPDSVSNWYLMFMNGDNGILYVKTKLETGRKLIIVKDSFGNALCPYFMNSFDEIYIVDFREFKLNLIDFITDKGITDCVFALNAFNATSNSAAQLAALRQQ